jgi:hypothetical protein
MIRIRWREAAQRRKPRPLGRGNRSFNQKAFRPGSQSPISRSLSEFSSSVPIFE